jgi:ribosomal protein S4
MSKNTISRVKACKTFGSFLWTLKKTTPKQKTQIREVQERQKNKLRFPSHRISFTKLHFNTKKLLQALYGKLSKQEFESLLFHVDKSEGRLPQGFLLLLERRLDVCLFRINFFVSVAAARQAIRHGFILVNNKPTKKVSQFIEAGDLIELQSFRCIDKLKKVSPGFLLYQEDTKLYNLTSFYKEWTKTLWTSLKSKRQLLQKKALHIHVSFRLALGIFLFPPQQIYTPLPLPLSLLLPNRKI